MTLLFLMLGFAGLLVSAVVSAKYMAELPRMPIPVEMRMTPRSILGVVVYETVEEHKRFTAIEHASTLFFVVGLGLGLVYMRQWGIANAMSAEEDEYSQDAP